MAFPPDQNAPMPGASAPDAAGPDSSAPPIGASPATQPVANRGMQAAGLAKMQVATKLLEGVLVMVGAGSEAGKDVLKALGALSKHLASGDISTGVEQSAMTDLMMKARQQAPQIAAMRAGAPAGSAPPGGAPPGAGGPPPALAAMMAGGGAPPPGP